MAFVAFVVYDPSGVIVRTGFGEEADLGTMPVADGETVLAGEGSIDQHYVDLTASPAIAARTVCDPVFSADLIVSDIPIGAKVEMAGELVPVRSTADGGGEATLPNLGPGAFQVTIRHPSIYPVITKVQRHPPAEAAPE
jgi:hypothetical protein